MTTARALRLLDVESAADRQALKQAYMDLVRVWHPDRFEGDERLRRKAAWKLSEISAAYRLLQLSGPASTSAVHRKHDVRAPRATKPVVVQSLPKRVRREWVSRVVATLTAVMGISLCVIASWAIGPRPASGSVSPSTHESPVAPSGIQRRAAHKVATQPPPPRASIGSAVKRVRSPFSRDLDRVLARSMVQLTDMSVR